MLHLVTVGHIVSQFGHTVSHCVTLCPSLVILCQSLSNCVTFGHTVTVGHIVLQLVTSCHSLVTLCHIWSLVSKVCHTVSHLVTVCHIWSQCVTVGHTVLQFGHTVSHFVILCHILVILCHSWSKSGLIQNDHKEHDDDQCLSNQFNYEPVTKKSQQLSCAIFWSVGVFSLLPLDQKSRTWF